MPAVPRVLALAGFEEFPDGIAAHTTFRTEIRHKGERHIGQDLFPGIHSWTKRRPHVEAALVDHSGSLFVPSLHRRNWSKMEYEEDAWLFPRSTSKIPWLISSPA